MIRSLPGPSRDIVLLVVRIVLGFILFAHGWQKLMINGISGTMQGFEKLGIPLAILSASFVTVAEFVGGALLILGAATTVAVACNLVVMIGAAGFVHAANGIFVKNGGWELVGVIAACLLALAAAGPGRFSIDHLVISWRMRNETTPVPTAPGDPSPAEDRPVAVASGTTLFEPDRASR